MKYRKLKSWARLCVGGGIVGFGLTAICQSVPSLLNYQGFLEDAGGHVRDADYLLEFRVYSVPEGGEPVWGPQIFDGTSGEGRGSAITVSEGYFGTILGPADVDGRPLSEAFNGDDRWIEIRVIGRPPFSPRQRITSSPYAFKAAGAVRAESVDEVNVDSLGDDVRGLFDELRSEIAFLREELQEARAEIINRPIGTEGPLSLYVDASVPVEAEGDGSRAQPFHNLAQAVNSLPRQIDHKVEINILPGEYHGWAEFNDITTTRRGTLTIQSVKPEGHLDYNLDERIGGVVKFVGDGARILLTRSSHLGIRGLIFQTGSGFALVLNHQSRASLQQCRFLSKNGAAVLNHSFLSLHDVEFVGDSDGNSKGDAGVQLERYASVKFRNERIQIGENADGPIWRDERYKNIVKGYRTGVQLYGVSAAFTDPLPEFTNNDTDHRNLSMSFFGPEAAGTRGFIKGLVD